MKTIHIDPRIGIQRAKLIIKYPYYGYALLKLNFIPSKTTATFKCDERGNIQYNEEFLEKRTPEDIRFVMLHENEHILRNHHQRYKSMYPSGGSKEDILIWNLASDLEINSALAEYETPPDDAVLPDQYQLPRRLTAEQYDRLIREILDQQKDNQQEGKDQNQSGNNKSNGNSTGPKGGKQPKDDKQEDQDQPSSGGKDKKEDQEQDYPNDPQSDNQMLDNQWKDLSPDNQSTPESREMYGEGMSVPESNAMREHTAQLMKQAGNLHAAQQALLGIMSAVPRVDWKKEVRLSMMKYISSTTGDFDYSYAKMSRRQGDDEFIKCGTVGVDTVVVFMIDTSGSIDTKHIHQALMQVRKIAHTVEAPVHVISCDTEATYHGLVYDAEKERSFSRGGTDLREAIDLGLKYNPTLMVLVTDGYSPFHNERPRVPIIMLQVPGATDEVPSYFKKIKMEDV